MNYDKNDFASYLIKGQLHEAVNYLREFPDKKDSLEGYINVFEKGEYYKRTDNEVITNIDRIYQDYYRNVFWNNLSNKNAEKILFHQLWEVLGSNKALPKDESIENEIALLVQSEGYQYLGGVTQGYYGPYIWEKSTEETYQVEIPSGIQPYSIIMMEGFVSRSWLDFLSFGRTGAGGWAGEDGMLYCVKSSYENVNEDIFNISFLKHEAQHAYDKSVYPCISSVDLEYRAKLVELIYWKNADKLIAFLNEADDTNPNNSHAFASYKIITGLSEKIFGTKYENRKEAWEKETDEIKKFAMKLLEESNNRLSR